MHVALVTLYAKSTFIIQKYNTSYTITQIHNLHTCMLMSPNKEVKLVLLLVVGGAALLLLVTDSPSNILAVDCC